MADDKKGTKGKNNFIFFIIFIIFSLLSIIQQILEFLRFWQLRVTINYNQIGVLFAHAMLVKAFSILCVIFNKPAKIQKIYKNSEEKEIFLDLYILFHYYVLFVLFLVPEESSRVIR